MKKLSYLIFTFAILMIHASCNMDGGCKPEGKWKVKSAEVQSTKFSQDILEMTKSEIESSQFDFAPDGKVSWTTGENGAALEGTWSIDEAANQLLIALPGRAVDKYNIISCSSNEMSCSQRAPEDPQQEAILTINTTFERVK